MTLTNVYISMENCRENFSSDIHIDSCKALKEDRPNQSVLPGGDTSSAVVAGGDMAVPQDDGRAEQAEHVRLASPSREGLELFDHEVSKRTSMGYDDINKQISLERCHRGTPGSPSSHGESASTSNYKPATCIVCISERVIGHFMPVCAGCRATFKQSCLETNVTSCFQYPIATCSLCEIGLVSHYCHKCQRVLCGACAQGHHRVFDFLPQKVVPIEEAAIEHTDRLQRQFNKLSDIKQKKTQQCREAGEAVNVQDVETCQNNIMKVISLGPGYMLKQSPDLIKQIDKITKKGFTLDHQVASASPSTQNQVTMCGLCEVRPVTHYCQDCQGILCTDCVYAHHTLLGCSPKQVSTVEEAAKEGTKRLEDQLNMITDIRQGTIRNCHKESNPAYIWNLEICENSIKQVISLGPWHILKQIPVVSEKINEIISKSLSDF